jgi:thioredoxin-related protein
MRKILLLGFAIGLLNAPAFGQGTKEPAKTETPANDTLKPYQKYPKLPAFNIMLMDSVTVFNTYNIPEGRKTILLFFSPDCSHCQALFRELTKNMDSLRDVDFYLMSPVHNISMIRNFYSEYHLADFKNIKVAGRDYEYFFITYYGIKSFPDMALYDEHKKLIKLFEGDIPLKELFKYTR